MGFPQSCMLRVTRYLRLHDRVFIVRNHKSPLSKISLCVLPCHFALLSIGDVSLGLLHRVGHDENAIVSQHEEVNARIKHLVSIEEHHD